MKYKKPDKYITLTPQCEIDICENCPFPLPVCGRDGCEYFRNEKAKFLEAKGDKRRRVIAPQNG